MKTIRIQISEPERQELFLLRQKSGDYRSERALAVLHCADGKRPRQIADMLKRSSQAICQWLHAYQKDGLAGLDKDYSPGRTSVRKEKLIPHLSEYLAKSPRDFGWGEGVWSVRVYHKPFVDWIWIGCILMALGGGLAISDRRYRLKPRRQHAAQPLPEATS